MKFEEITEEIKKKIYRPIYFLMGEEPYFIDEITKQISDTVLTEDEKTFNQVVLYGKDIDAAAIINSAKRFPMMSNHQVVIIKEAQNIKSLDDLVYYVEKPLKSTILVINYKYGNLDKRKKLYKALQDKAVLFQSDKLREDKIPDFINQHVKKLNLSIELPAAQLLTEFVGDDISRIVNELEKMPVVLPQGSNKITSAHIEKFIGVSREYNNFELTKAISKRDILKTNKIAQHFAQNPKNSPLIVTIGILYGYFSKLLIFHFLQDKTTKNAALALGVNPYYINEYIAAAKIYSPAKVVNAINWLRECDMKSKGVGNSSTSDGDLLREFLFKVLH